MNKEALNKLYQYAQNRMLTDVQIELTDDHATNPVVLNLHKIILCVHSEYFRAMFLNDGFQDCHLPRISVHVPHVAVCCDIINSFYGVETNCQNLSQTEHILWTFICNDFLRIPIFIDRLVPLTDILPVHFDLLLTVVHILGCDDTMAQIIYDNIPDNYDVTKLAVELRARLLKLASTPVCMGTDNNKFCLWDVRTGKIMSQRTVTASCLSYLPQRRQILYPVNGYIYLEKIMHGVYHKQMACFNQTRFVHCCASLDSSLVAGISSLQKEDKRQILIYHLDELSLIDESNPTTTTILDVPAKSYISYCLSLAFSTDNQYILAAFAANPLALSPAHLQIWHIVQKRVCFDGPYKLILYPPILSFSYTIKDNVQPVLAISAIHQTFIHTIVQEENGIWSLSPSISPPYSLYQFIPCTAQLACVNDYQKQAGHCIKFYDFTPYGRLKIYGFNKMLEGSIDIPTINIDAIFRITYQPANQKLILISTGNNVYIYDYQTKQLEHRVHLAEDIIYTPSWAYSTQLYYQPLFDTELCDKLRRADQMDKLTKEDDVSVTDKE